MLRLRDQLKRAAHDLPGLSRQHPEADRRHPGRVDQPRHRQGLHQAGTKATQITDWPKADYQLGHGHAMAIVKLLKDRVGLK